MIDMRVRPKVQGILEPIGRFLGRLGVTPTFMTLFGLFVAIGGAVLIGTGQIISGALVALAGAALDGLDGSVARAADKVTERGGFLDATVDRLGEIAVLTGLAVSQRGEVRILLLTLLALGGSMLVPYMRAKAEALGIDGRGGLMGRAERVLLLTIGMLTGWIEPMLWVFVAASWFTAGQRFWTTYDLIEN
ncbi:MAG: CDP-alcohol phosphatidyltransferase family protein [Acidimicrobiia bacterium]